MKTLLHTVYMVLFFIAVVLCSTPSIGQTPLALQVIAIEGTFNDSAGRFYMKHHVLTEQTPPSTYF